MIGDQETSEQLSPKEQLKIILEEEKAKAEKFIDLAQTSYYKSLGIELTLDFEPINKAYKKCARIFHPDVFSGLLAQVEILFPELVDNIKVTQKAQENAFKKLGEIYIILSNEQSRTQYFNKLKKTQRKPAGGSLLDDSAIFAGTPFANDSK